MCKRTKSQVWVSGATFNSPPHPVMAHGCDPRAHIPRAKDYVNADIEVHFVNEGADDDSHNAQAA